ncbi:hypothetical protein C9975_04805, partial [Thalassospira xiamenensis]
LFCYCSSCEQITVLSDAYEERLFGIALWQKKGSEWLHVSNINIPFRYWPKVITMKLKEWAKGLTQRHNIS